MTKQNEKPRIYFIAKLDPYDGRVFDKDPRTFQSGCAHHTVKEAVELSEYAQLKQENENLKKIIAKELNENDEFGAEFVHVCILKQENERLTEDRNFYAKATSDVTLEALRLNADNKRLREALSFYTDFNSWTTQDADRDTIIPDDVESLKIILDHDGDESFEDIGGKRARQALKGE